MHPIFIGNYDFAGARFGVILKTVIIPRRSFLSPCFTPVPIVLPSRRDGVPRNSLSPAHFAGSLLVRTSIEIRAVSSYRLIREDEDASSRRRIAAVLLRIEAARAVPLVSRCSVFEPFRAPFFYDANYLVIDGTVAEYRRVGSVTPEGAISRRRFALEIESNRTPTSRLLCQ